MKTIAKLISCYTNLDGSKELREVPRVLFDDADASIEQTLFESFVSDMPRLGSIQTIDFKTEAGTTLYSKHYKVTSVTKSPDGREFYVEGTEVPEPSR